MKKIIAAFDGLRPSESTMDYAVYLSKTYHAHLTGVFLRESTRLGYAVYATIAEQSEAGREIFQQIERNDTAALNEAVADFELRCREAKLNFTIHRDKKNAVDELIHETIFADLLIVDGSESFSYMEGHMPGWFIKSVLHETKCPAIIVPKKFHPIDKLILLYDGKPASFYAIKMLNYILPEMGSMEIVLLCAKHDTLSMHLPDNKLLKEWMKRHYPRASYKVLKAYEKEIAGMLETEDPGTLIIAGAYSRSNISMMFHHSFADRLINAVKSPVFIAHS